MVINAKFKMLGNDLYILNFFAPYHKKAIYGIEFQVITVAPQFLVNSRR